MSTLYPGASPEVVDSLVGEPLETALQAVEGLESSGSTSQASFNSIQLQFAYGTDLNRARSQVDRVVSNLASQLPEEAETSSFAGSVSDFPVVFLALSGDEDLNELRRRAEAVLAPGCRSSRACAARTSSAAPRSTSPWSRTRRPSRPPG